MTYYKSWRIIDVRPQWVVVDINGKIINKNPTKEELTGLEKEQYKMNVKNRSKKYTDNELLDILRTFYVENGRPPTQNEFNVGDQRYPCTRTYIIRFGSWSNTLKLIGMDLDTRVLQGYLDTNQEKGRYAELKVINHFLEHPTDLAGENCLSPYDGICPNGKIYDVKSSKYYKKSYHDFGTNNKHKEEIEIYYFLAFNEDYTILEYVWRIPGEMVEKDHFQIGTSWAEFTLDSMKEYDITNKFKELDILEEN